MGLYTPFIEKSVNTIASGMQQKQQTDLAQSAYMGDPNALGQLYGINPELAEKIKRQKQQDQQNQLAQQAQKQKVSMQADEKTQKIARQIAGDVAKMPFEQAQPYAAQQAAQYGVELPPLTKDFHDQMVMAHGKGGNFASQQKFDYLAEKGGFTPDQVKKAAGIEAGLYPRATGSAAQTIASEGTANIIADTESTLAKGKETGKLEAQLDLKPKITAAVKLAEKAATEKGETFSDLSRMDAAMPGLVDTVGQLKELAMIATSTMGGKIFDAAVKETGFGATTGSTARAKFIAIINNQVLPLLKQTFGGSFSVQEGESLKATMGDPDASPAEKIAQLDAFIAQKERDIRAKRAEVSAPADTGILDQARAAIAGGADRQAVINRLKENGIDAGGL